MSEEDLEATQPFFRIAIRAEGEYVNAYFAPRDTMENAIHLGSIRRRLCDSAPHLFANFRELMQAAVTVMIQESLGLTPENFVTTPAPEHEKAGNG